MAAPPSISTLLRDRIAERMAELGLSPTDLETRSGLTGPGLAPIRRGEIRKYQVRLKRPLCAALGWTPDSIDRLLAGQEPQLADDSPASLGSRLDQLFTALQDASQLRGAQIEAIASGVESNGKALKAVAATLRRLEVALRAVPIQPPPRPSGRKHSEGHQGSHSAGDSTPHRGTPRR